MKPLVVDLDGTLVKTDLFFEATFLFLFKHPLNIFRLCLWLLKGKAYCKAMVAASVDLNVAALPFQEEFLEFLKDEKAKGRRLVLATAANENYAFKIAEQVTVFDEVLASNENYNMAGSNKAAKLIELFGEKGFDYAGNAKVDGKVWGYSQNAIVVNPFRGALQKAKGLTTVSRVFEDRPNSYIKTFLKQLRIHQWVKNVLIFVPWLLGHDFLNFSSFTNLIIAFFSFSLCASAVYILNDLVDIENDREHSIKRFRPLAAGNFSIIQAFILIPLLLIAAFALAMFVSWEFAVVVALYLMLTSLYSFWIKRLVLIDVIMLAMLYTTRIIAGAVALREIPSFWILALSMCLFLSLALMKRYTELRELRIKGKLETKGRGYHTDDLELLLPFGAASSYGAVIILALYINSNQVVRNYSQPEFIWLLCLFLLYWTTRAWLLAYRGEMNSDPIIFALRDRASWVIAFLSIIVIMFAL